MGKVRSGWEEEVEGDLREIWGQKLHRKTNLKLAELGFLFGFFYMQ